MRFNNVNYFYKAIVHFENTSEDELLFSQHSGVWSRNIRERIRWVFPPLRHSKPPPLPPHTYSISAYLCDNMLIVFHRRQEVRQTLAKSEEQPFLRAPTSCTRENGPLTSRGCCCFVVYFVVGISKRSSVTRSSLWTGPTMGFYIWKHHLINGAFDFLEIGEVVWVAKCVVIGWDGRTLYNCSLIWCLIYVFTSQKMRIFIKQCQMMDLVIEYRIYIIYD